MASEIDKTIKYLNERKKIQCTLISTMTFTRKKWSNLILEVVDPIPPMDFKSVNR